MLRHSVHFAMALGWLIAECKEESESGHHFNRDQKTSASKTSASFTAKIKSLRPPKCCSWHDNKDMDQNPPPDSCPF